MKKIPIVIVLLLIAGVTLTVFAQSYQSSTSTSGATATQNSTSLPNKTEVEKQKKKQKSKTKKKKPVAKVVKNEKASVFGYVDYFDGALAKTASTDKIVLFFHAGWCPSCRNADKNLSAMPIKSGYTILKADYDTSLELRKKYGVTTQHTFVQIDKSGDLIKKWSGSPDFNSILSQIQ
jgi:thiol-disulfide isomerase/thioredoxin